MSRGPATRIAFFDVDRTVIRGATVSYAIRYFVGKGEMSLRHLARGAFYAALHHVNLLDYDSVFRQAVAPFVGMPEEEVIRISRECFESLVKGKIYADAVERIRGHVERGEPPVLISSGPRYIVYALRDHLRVPHAIASGPKVVAGRVTAEPDGDLCYKEGKLRRAREYSAERGISLDDCYFYSDSISDLPLLSAVGCPRVVNPDPLLRREARRRGWEVLRFER